MRIQFEPKIWELRLIDLDMKVPHQFLCSHQSIVLQLMKIPDCFKTSLESSLHIGMLVYSPLYRMMFLSVSKSLTSYRSSGSFMISFRLFQMKIATFSEVLTTLAKYGTSLSRFL